MLQRVRILQHLSLLDLNWGCQLPELVRMKKENLERRNHLHPSIAAQPELTPTGRELLRHLCNGQHMRIASYVQSRIVMAEALLMVKIRYFSISS